MLLALLLFLAHAEAEPFAEWMMSLQRPDMPGPCCGPADQVYVDDYQPDMATGGFVGRVASTGAEVRIPAEKVIWDRVNPTGRGVLFMTPGGGFVYCFVPGAGA